MKLKSYGNMNLQQKKSSFSAPRGEGRRRGVPKSCQKDWRLRDYVYDKGELVKNPEKCTCIAVVVSSGLLEFSAVPYRRLSKQ